MANVVEFTIRGIDKATGPLGKLSKVLSTAVKGITAAASAASAAAGGVFLLTDRITKSQDAIAKMSSRLGIATDKLSQFHFIAQRGGVSTTNFNLALQRMTRRVAEAAQGTGEAQTAIKELNLNAKVLNNLPLDKQMRVIATELSKVKNQADKVRLAFKLFDSEGVAAVLQTIDDLGPGFDEVIKDFRFLGGEVVPQAAANAEVFQNQMVRVRTSLFGLGQAISNRVAPAMSEIAKQFANFVARNRERVAAFVESAINGFIKLFVTTKTILGRLTNVFNEAFGSTGGFAKVFANLVENFFIALGGMIDLIIKTGPAFLAAFVAVFKGVWEAFLFLGREAFVNLLDFINGTDVGLGLEEALKVGLEKGINSAAPVVRAALADISTEVGFKTAEIANSLGGIFDGIGAEVEAATNKIAGNLGKVSEEVAEVSNSMTESTLDGMIRTVEGGRILIESLSTETKELLATLGETWLAEQEMFKEGLIARSEALTEFNQQQFAMLEEADAFLAERIQNSIDAVSDSLSSALLAGQSLSKALASTFKSLLTQVISFLVKTGLQRLILSKVTVGATAAEGSAELSKAFAATFANTFASVSAAPWPISLTAPAVAASHLAQVAGGSAGASATGAAFGAGLGAGPVSVPVAHGGLDFVPREETFLLNRGERVVQPRANQDLTNFLNDVGAGGASIGGTRPVSVENLTIEVLPNATNLDALREISVDELREEFIFKIIEALDGVDRIGVRPNFAERSRTS